MLRTKKNAATRAGISSIGEITWKVRAGIVICAPGWSKFVLPVLGLEGGTVSLTNVKTEAGPETPKLSQMEPRLSR